jgi:hypothetical protein
MSQNFISDYAGDAPEEIPSGLSTVFSDIKDAATQAAINSISETAFTILIFIISFLLVKIILGLIIKTFSKKSHSNFIIGGIDSAFGLILGTTKGIIVIFVLIIFIFPFAFAVNKDIYIFMDEQMSSSIIADFIILNNPIPKLIPTLDISAFLPSNWSPEINDTISKNLDNLV